MDTSDQDQVIWFNPTPDISLVLALIKNRKKFLWTTEKNLMIPCFEFGAVGIGEAYARFLLKELWFNGDVRSIAMLVAYVIFLVRGHVTSCGHDTDLFIIDDTG